VACKNLRNISRGSPLEKVQDKKTRRNWLIQIHLENRHQHVGDSGGKNHNSITNGTQYAFHDPDHFNLLGIFSFTS